MQHPSQTADLTRIRHATLLREADAARLANELQRARPSPLDKLRGLFSHVEIPRLVAKVRAHAG